MGTETLYVREIILSYGGNVARICSHFNVNLAKTLMLLSVLRAWLSRDRLRDV
jgi:hypothetical protein